MDLREKPGKVQKVLEILMRIRLLSAVVLVVATVSLLVSNWQAVVSLPVAASESLAVWMSEVNGDNFFDSAKYLLVSVIASVVLFLVFGKVRGAVAAGVGMLLSAGILLLMGGNETVPLMFFAVLTMISIVMILFVKLSVACMLFPFVLSWMFLSSLVAVLQPSLEPSYLTWAVLSAVGFAGALAFSVLTGKSLSEGMPQGGALSRAAKQVLLPVLITSVMAVCAVAFDIPATTAENLNPPSVSDNALFALLYFVVFNLWFFVILFPLMTFAPWDRLRSGNRRVEMKEKKKTSKGKKNK